MWGFQSSSPFFKILRFRGSKLGAKVNSVGTNERKANHVRNWWKVTEQYNSNAGILKIESVFQNCVVLRVKTGGKGEKYGVNWTENPLCQKWMKSMKSKILMCELKNWTNFSKFWDLGAKNWRQRLVQILLMLEIWMDQTSCKVDDMGTKWRWRWSCGF